MPSGGEGKGFRRREEQVRLGRERAQRHRAEQGRIRKAVYAGELDGVKLCRGDYEELEPVIESWRLSRLLWCVRGIGEESAVIVYVEGSFSPRQRVRSLSPERRKHLARLVEQARVTNQYR